MHDTRAALPGLPGPLLGRLSELLDGLLRALSDGLCAVVAYGSAVRGGFDADRSDVDLVVVLRDTSLERLEAVSNALVLARYGGRIETMILKEGEITHSADVFPILYADIRERHAVLYSQDGRDPFAALEISPNHLRLRIEQELREAKIRLRRAVVDGLGTDEALGRALARKVRQVRSPLRALLLLKGRRVGDRLEEVLAAAGEAWGQDASRLLSIEADPRAAHATFRSLMDAALHDVDELGGPA